MTSHIINSNKLCITPCNCPSSNNKWNIGSKSIIIVPRNNAFRSRNDRRANNRIPNPTWKEVQGIVNLLIFFLKCFFMSCRLRKIINHEWHIYILTIQWRVVILSKDDIAEVEITELINKYFDAYKKKDRDKALSCYANEPSTVVIGSETGEKRVGYEELKEQIAKDFKKYEFTKIDLPWKTVTIKGPIALLSAEVDLAMKVGDEERKTTARLTAAMEKKKDEWLIVQSHLSLPSPIEVEK